MTSAHPRLSRVSAAIALSFALAAAPALAADAFLKLGDIKGESEADKHKGQIEVLSWSWGEAEAATGSYKLEKVYVKSWSTSGDADSPEVERETTESSGNGSRPLHPPPDDTKDVDIGDMTLKGSKIGGNAAPGDAEVTLKRGATVGGDSTAGKLRPGTKLQVKLTKPLKKGSLTAAVPAGTCRVGARYPTAEFATGESVYRMEDVVVFACAPAASNGGPPMEHMAMGYARIR